MIGHLERGEIIISGPSGGEGGVDPVEGREE